MPLMKINGEYRTPGGCSAWNGKTFGGAAVDAKCGGAAINFSRGGWYYLKNMTLAEIFHWFEDREDPGCAWNASSKEFKDQWRPISQEEFDGMLWDKLWSSSTRKWENTFARPELDWFEPCPPPDADGEDNVN